MLSDNGNGYRSFAWRDACAELEIQRRYTRSRRPQTNGKAEALVKTLLREWAYRFAYPSSGHRARSPSPIEGSAITGRITASMPWNTRFGRAWTA